MTPSHPIRILSIDGGGIRGIIPGQVLIALEEKLAKKFPDKPRIADHFDLVAGTSTGGILTCAYLLPDRQKPDRPRFTANEVHRLYMEEGEKIFSLSAGQRLRSFFGLGDEKYSARNLEEVLRNYFGGVWLKELLRPCVITSYDITNRRGHFFKKHEAEKPEKKDYNFLVCDVARATSAAPTYFECPNIEAETGERFPLVDGGVFVSNPAMCAYAEARKIFGVGAKDIILLSLGTGHTHKSYPWKKARRWGKVGWIRPVIDIMMSGVSEVVHFQLQQLFTSAGASENYLRIDTKIPETMDPEMDHASKENRLALSQLGKELAFRDDEALNRLVSSSR